MKLIKKFTYLRNRIKNIFVGLLLRFKKFPLENSIIIFSEARGGSTWLMEMISESIDVNINWEPLHKTKGVVPKGISLGARPLIQQDQNNNKFINLFKDIHTFKRHSSWTRKYLINKGIRKIMKTDFVLTKYVRANLSVPFILNYHVSKYKPIFLIRHPIDTCLSQKKAFNNNKELVYKVPVCLNNSRYSNNKEYIEGLESDLEKRIAVWCMNNCPTINNMGSLELFVVYYSDLVLDPKAQLSSILKEFQFTDVEQRLARVNFRKASSTNFGGDYKIEPKNQLHKNFDRISEDNKEAIQKVFDYFGFELFSAFSPFPCKKIFK